MNKYLFPVIIIVSILLSACSTPNTPSAYPLNEDDQMKLIMTIGDRDFFSDHCPELKTWQEIPDEVGFTINLNDDYRKPFTVKAIALSIIRVDSYIVEFHEDSTTVYSGGYEIDGVEKRQAINKAKEMLGGITRYKVTFTVTPTLTDGEMSFTTSNFACSPLRNN